MRLSSTILTIFALFAGLAVVRSPGAAGPPPPGGATRSAYTTATCYTGFTPNPGSYPALSQDVKYQCLNKASCPALFSVTNPNTVRDPVMFEYGCTGVNLPKGVGTATCAAGFAPSVPTYSGGWLKETYFCSTKPVTCPASFSVITNNDAESGASAGPPPRFFYACISSGPHS